MDLENKVEQEFAINKEYLSPLDYSPIDFNVEIDSEDAKDLQGKLYGQQRDLIRDMIYGFKDMFSRFITLDTGLVSKRRADLEKLSRKSLSCKKLYYEISKGVERLEVLETEKLARYKELTKEFHERVLCKEELEKRINHNQNLLKQELNVETESIVKNVLTQDTLTYNTIVMDINLLTNEVNQYASITTSITANKQNAIYVLNKVQIELSNTEHAKKLIKAVEPLSNIPKVSVEVKSLNDTLKELVDSTDKIDDIVAQSLMELQNSKTNLFKTKKSEDAKRKFEDLTIAEIDKKIADCKKVIGNGSR